MIIERREAVARGIARRALTLGLALLLDQALGEPPSSLHPVVAIGRLIGVLERRAPTVPPWRALGFGALIASATFGIPTVLAAVFERLTSELPGVPRLLVQAAALKPTFAVRALFAAGRQVYAPLVRDDLQSAREALRSLVSRDTSTLDRSLIVAAAVESLAENANDSIVAPALAYLIGGLPAAYGYRAANTLDAMIGYRGKYEYLGKPAARLDDLLNVLPARLTAFAIVVGAGLSGADVGRALRVAIRDWRRTASPNAGWPMSAIAGALGVQLEKVGHYRLGDPTRPVVPADIPRAERIVKRGLAALGVAAVGWTAVMNWRTRDSARTTRMHLDDER